MFFAILYGLGYGKNLNAPGIPITGLMVGPHALSKKSLEYAILTVHLRIAFFVLFDGTLCTE
jgi:hypothetical protein